jgi:hypothetical protein
MAFDRLERFGDEQMDRRFKVLGAWLCTMLSQSGKSFQPDDIKGISPPELPTEADIEIENDLFADPDADFSDAADGPSSADVLQALREQNQFRF